MCFNPEFAEEFLRIERRPAAVLIPVVHREPVATLLFTERVASLRAHAGQISFPGGRIDPEDAGPVEAALREAEEEIGLSSDFVETLALAPDYLTGSGYHVAPVIAVIRPDFKLRLNPAEVASVFEVPLSFVMDPANHLRGTRDFGGKARKFFAIPYEGRNIWGITAGMVRILYERLYADADGAGAVKHSLRDWPLLKEPAMRAVLDALDGEGRATRIVGGAVRDALLERPVTDADLATIFEPDEVIRRAEAAGLKTAPTGIAHGTVTVIAEGAAFRGDDAPARRRDGRPPRRRPLHQGLGARRGAARFHHERALLRRRRSDPRSDRRHRGSPRRPRPLHRRRRGPHPRGLSPRPALLPLLRLVRIRAAGLRWPSGLRAAEGAASRRSPRSGSGPS